MLTIGIDPDVKDLAIAAWDDGPLDAAVVHVKGSAPGSSAARMAQHLFTSLIHSRTAFQGKPVAIAIEGQQVDRRTKRSRDLFTLAHVTGAALYWSVQRYPESGLIVPTPSEWKGQIAKHAHQARLYDELGWGYEIVGSGTSRYARPVEAPSTFKHISKGQWKHVGDALLLARWAQDQA